MKKTLWISSNLSVPIWLFSGTSWFYVAWGYVMNIFLLVVCSDYTVIQSVNIQECVQLPPPSYWEIRIFHAMSFNYSLLSPNSIYFSRSMVNAPSSIIHFFSPHASCSTHIEQNWFFFFVPVAPCLYFHERTCYANSCLPYYFIGSLEAGIWILHLI